LLESSEKIKIKYNKFFLLTVSRIILEHQTLSILTYAGSYRGTDKKLVADI